MKSVNINERKSIYITKISGHDLDTLSIIQQAFYNLHDCNITNLMF